MSAADDSLARRISGMDRRSMSMTTGTARESWTLSGVPYVRVDLDGEGMEREMISTSPVPVGDLCVVLNDGSGFSVCVGSLSSDIGAESGSLLPPGGTTGMVLTKQSDYDYDADWQTAAMGGGGGGWSPGTRIVTGRETVGPHSPVPSVEGAGYIKARNTRISLTIQNLTNGIIWVGGDPDVAPHWGLGISAGQYAVITGASRAPVYIYGVVEGPVTWLSEEE